MSVTGRSGEGQHKDMAPTFPAVSKGGYTGWMWMSHRGTVGTWWEGCLEKGAWVRVAP